MFDTSMGTKAIESMQLKEVPFDQGAAPINAATQKTTALWCTPNVYKFVMSDEGFRIAEVEGRSSELAENGMESEGHAFQDSRF